jgi:signal transduction histidine kinase
VGAARVNVLLVDDRQENLLALDAALRPLGENLITAQSGKEALKQLLDNDVAVILMDVKMPGMDGFETAAIIRQRARTALTPIIFITAQYREDEHLTRGYSVGAVDYIVKPFSPDVLRSKVSVFVELYRKTEEIKRQSEIIRQIEQREYEHRLAEAKRRMEAQNYRVLLERQITQAIVEHAPLGILRVDNNLLVSEVNRVFTQQFNTMTEDLMRKNLVIALPNLPQTLVEAIQRGEQFQVEQFKIDVQSDTSGEAERYLDLTVWPVKGQDDTNIGTVLLAMDVTERVWLNQQREDFVATLAHDLQTPVIASDRACELLLESANEKLHPDSLKMISMLKKNNQNLLGMIQSLLEVYRYQSGAQSLYLDSVDMGLLATRCIEDLFPLAEKQGLSLSADFEESGPLFALADQTAIRRVIMNLLDNAIKYTQRGGNILVTARGGEQSVIVEVTDNGPGISEKDLGHLFKRYWHGSQGHKTYKPSCGLGLYLCKQIIEAHLGQISCESTVGSGTKFTVVLPTARPIDPTISTAEPTKAAS